MVNSKRLGAELDGSEYWHVAVFCSERATGNPTGVVILGEAVRDSVCSSAAALIGHPDTAFLWPCESGVWYTKTFSPAESISFCVQTLLASLTVLRRKTGDDRFSFLLGERRVSVRADAEIPDTAWVEAHRNEIRILGESRLNELSDALGADTGVVVASGRKRVYIALSRDQLRTVRLLPESVTAFCHSAGIHGVCLFAPREASLSIALRVFITSLDGREDSATGGAVLGLLTLMLETGRANEGDVWNIDQGHGPRHLRGTLLARCPGKGVLEIGGRCLPIARGVLLDQDFPNSNERTD